MSKILYIVLLTSNALIANVALVNDIEFDIDEDCVFEGDELSLEIDYNTYNWENASLNVDLGDTPSISINSSGTYCVTITDFLDVECSACIDIELSEMPFVTLVDAIYVCSEDLGNGVTSVDFNSLFIAGHTDGIWSDNSSVGVDLSSPTNVDFAGVEIGEYIFSYSLEGDCIDLYAEITVFVVECQCPTLSLSNLGSYCNTNPIQLTNSESGLNGNWFSSGLNIENNIIQLDNLIPGIYDITFSISDDVGGCPTDFETTIEVLGCFKAEEVLSVDVNSDQLIFTWTDEIETLDIEIVVLNGPIGIRDGNAYIMSGMSEGEVGGIEIFINTEGYQYDGDLIIYGTTANTTTIHDPVDLRIQFSIYPNPVKDILSIKNANFSSIESIEIFTSTGMNSGANIVVFNNTIDVSKLSKGYYVLMLSAEGQKFRIPFVII